MRLGLETCPRLTRQNYSGQYAGHVPYANWERQHPLGHTRSRLLEGYGRPPCNPRLRIVFPTQYIFRLL